MCSPPQLAKDGSLTASRGLSTTPDQPWLTTKLSDPGNHRKPGLKNFRRNFFLIYHIKVYKEGQSKPKASKEGRTGRRGGRQKPTKYITPKNTEKRIKPKLVP